MTDEERRRQRGADLSDRARAMDMSPDEVWALINFLIGAAPDAVEGALDHVERVR